MTTRVMPPPDWTPPALCYLIAASARSGSTLLIHILRQAGVFGRPDEYFNRDWLHSVIGGPLPVVQDCFHHAWQHGRGPDGTLGIKLVGGQLRYLTENAVVEAWLPERRWILLRRRDLLGQAISHVIAEQTDAWSSLQRPRQTPVYDSRAIIAALAVALEENAALSLQFATRRERVVELFYEDFEQDHGHALDAIRTHFALDPLPVPKAECIRIVRQRDALNELWRERFLDEMQDGGSDIDVVLMLDDTGSRRAC
jgi:LPS sulfotransferase NodH